MFFGSDFESQTSALSAHICPAKELKYPPKKKKTRRMAFCITQRKLPNHRFFVPFLFRFEIIHRPSDPRTLRPIKMSFPQNTSYIALILPIFWSSHVISMATWRVIPTLPTARLFKTQRLVELTDVDDDLGVESSRDPDRIPRVNWQHVKLPCQ